MKDEIRSRAINYLDQKDWEAEQKVEQKRLEAEEIESIVRATGKTAQEVKDALAIAKKEEAEAWSFREILSLLPLTPLVALPILMMSTMNEKGEVPAYAYPLAIGYTAVCIGASKAIEPKC